MLMNWSRRRIRQLLREGADLLGLKVTEVIPNYTSRQDSRTGAPGLRGQIVEAGRLRGRKDWAQRVQRAAGSDDPLNEYICQLDSLLSRLRRSAMVFVPVPGGDIFIPADPGSPAAGGVQADINAAANIGLKVIMDPDWPGSWWRLPVDSRTGRPDTRDRMRGCRVPGLQQVQIDPANDEEGIRNFWRDPSSQPLDQGEWQPYASYWRDVERRVLTRILSKLGHA